MKDNNCDITFFCSDPDDQKSCVYFSSLNDGKRCKYFIGDRYERGCNSAVACVNRMVLKLKEQGINFEK